MPRRSRLRPPFLHPDDMLLHPRLQTRREFSSPSAHSAESGRVHADLRERPWNAWEHRLKSWWQHKLQTEFFSHKSTARLIRKSGL